MLQKWGATGLLVEYEDMFPYWDSLAEIASGNAYRSACYALMIFYTCTLMSALFTEILLVLTII